MSMAINLLKDSWPLIFSGMVISIYMKVDQIMIKEMLDTEALGQYSAAVRFAEAWYFIPMIIASSLFPAIINAKKISKELCYARIQKLYNLMVWLSLAIAFPMTFLSDFVMELFYGQQYNQAGGVLMIYIWAGVFVFLGVVNTKWLLNENLQFILFINTLIGATVNVFFNYMLIGSIGIEGAAWSSLISYCLAAYLCLVFYKRTRISFFNMTKSLFFFGVINVKKNN